MSESEGQTLGNLFESRQEAKPQEQARPRQEVESRQQAELVHRAEPIQVEPLPPVRPVDWRSVRQAAHERYTTESRIANGAQITERAQDGINRIRARLAASGRTPDELDAALVAAYGFGAAQLIEEYMTGR